LKQKRSNLLQHQVAIADFTGSAVLQSACGSQLQRHTLRLAVPANLTIALFKSLTKKIKLNQQKIWQSG
jgi:hypothetical protein